MTVQYLVCSIVVSWFTVPELQIAASFLSSLKCVDVAKESRTQNINTLWKSLIKILINFNKNKMPALCILGVPQAVILVNADKQAILGCYHVTYFRCIFQDKINYTLAVLIYTYSLLQEKTQLPQIQISTLSPTQCFHDIVN